jgi:hypothetical protein
VLNSLPTAYRRGDLLERDPVVEETRIDGHPTPSPSQRSTAFGALVQGARRCDILINIHILRRGPY